MKKLEGFRYLYPQGAYYIFIDIRHFLKAGETSLTFSDRLLEQHLIAIAPGEAFGAPGYLRLSYAVNETALLDGIARLHKAFTAES